MYFLAFFVCLFVGWMQNWFYIVNIGFYIVDFVYSLNKRNKDAEGEEECVFEFSEANCFSYLFHLCLTFCSSMSVILLDEHLNGICGNQGESKE